jgi:VWFA-related protein
MRITATLLLAIGAVQMTVAQNKPEPFRVGVDVVQTDAIVRDTRGQFIADLKAGEFEVYEDGVKQEIVSLTMIHGGREYNVLSPPAPSRDGLILPPSRPRNDTAGRIFVIIIDDFHLEPAQAQRSKAKLAELARGLERSQLEAGAWRHEYRAAFTTAFALYALHRGSENGGAIAAR